MHHLLTAYSEVWSLCGIGKAKVLGETITKRWSHSPSRSRLCPSSQMLPGDARALSA